MSWEKEVEEIRRRVELAKGMGGVENIKRQHDGGKLTVRERIERLLDAGTFHEYGALAGSPKYEGDTLASITPANFVGGTGRINGRRVVVGGDDFTVRGGAADANIGNGYTLLSIAGVILGGGEFVGGVVSPIGAVIGALTMAMAASPLLTFMRIPPDWQVAANGAILIIVLAARVIITRKGSER